MLENDQCRKEYAIAKRHPEIGRQLPLVECSELPDTDDCMSIGITMENARESKTEYTYLEGLIDTIWLLYILNFFFRR